MSKPMLDGIRILTVEQYRAGSAKVFGFLVGQLMKETRGKAKADVANEVLRSLLDTL